MTLESLEPMCCEKCGLHKMRDVEHQCDPEGIKKLESFSQEEEKKCEYCIEHELKCPQEIGQEHANLTASSPQSKEGWEERFDEQFIMIGNPLKHLYVRDWHLPADTDDLKSFISNAIAEAKREERELIRKEVEGMIRKSKPTHGTCCTCQTCGRDNDYECDCPRNEVLQEVLSKLTTTEV